MIRALRALAVVLAVGVATALLAGQAPAAPTVDGEFAIPNGVGTDNDIVEGPDGNMWVTLEGTAGTNGVARITPAGNVTEFPLANTSYGIAVGPDDNLWVSTAIGVIKVPPEDPDNPTPYDIGLTDGRGIVAGPDDQMWVAGKDQLVSFGVADPEGTDVSTPITNLTPHGMSVGSDGLTMSPTARPTSAPPTTSGMNSPPTPPPAVMVAVATQRMANTAASSQIALSLPSQAIVG